jgi:hypothetical protein
MDRSSSLPKPGPEFEPVRGPDVNVLALVKGDERYIFLFTDERRRECVRVMRGFATNPELSFTAYDAAVLSQRVVQDGKE